MEQGKALLRARETHDTVAVDQSLDLYREDALHVLYVGVLAPNLVDENGQSLVRRDDAIALRDRGRMVKEPADSRRQVLDGRIEREALPQYLDGLGGVVLETGHGEG